MPFSKIDPNIVRDPVTVRIERNKIKKINRYCKHNNVHRSELLADIIDTHIDELKIPEE